MFGPISGSATHHATLSLRVDCEFKAVLLFSRFALNPRGSIGSATKLDTKELKL